MDKIENLNLIALRKYACAKVNGQKEWYLKCLECPTIESCKIGMRARDVLDTQTKPGMSEEAHNAIVSGARLGGEMRRLVARKKAEEILSHSHGEKEIRNSMLLDASPVSKCSIIYNKASRWKKSFPDLEEKYHFMDACRIIGEAKFASTTVSEMLRYLREEVYKDDYAEKVVDDAITLEDFLKETEDIPAMRELEELPESVTDEESAPVSGDKSKEAPAEVTPTPEQLVIQKQFGLKKQILRKRIYYLQEEISKFTEEVTKVQAQMDILDAAAELFGMRPTT